MVSIVIPTYNARNNIKELLDSIFSSNLEEEKEVIVVDDASTDGTGELVRRYPVKLITNGKNQGSAKARNIGVSYARGEKIIFFDADVVIEPDTLSKLINYFEIVSKKGTLIGIYSKEPLNKGFISEYKALLDYNHWREVKGCEVSSFEPRCAIIRRDIFYELGGFDEKIKGADVEDYELGYRLLKKYKIYFDKTIQVRHRFPSTFRAIAKNFFQRGSSWTGLFLVRRKFDNVATTPKAALACILASLSTISLSILYFHKIFSLVFLLFFLLYLYFSKGFFTFVYQEKGLLFFLKAIGLHFILNIILILGSIKGIFSYLFRKI